MLPQAGSCFVGSSSFTRYTNGASRGNFAFADEMGVHMVTPALTNWTSNQYFTRQTEHRLVSHIPLGQLNWRMPSSSEEISWGVSPSHPFSRAARPVAGGGQQRDGVGSGRPQLLTL